ncbi:MAG: hypothetical protein OEV28_11325 [Nitrospirota bacterium]|nr:hypothetical protein [Nitrospirota bacterium]
MEGPKKGMKRKLFGAILIMLSGLDYLLAMKGNFAPPLFTVSLFVAGIVLCIWGVIADSRSAAQAQSNAAS